MKLFTIQVKTGGEEKYVKLFSSQNIEAQIKFHFPKRELEIRRAGRVSRELTPIFPGYLFLDMEDEDNILQWKDVLRKTHGFFRFLPRNDAILPLQGRDLETILHFIGSINEIVGVSKVVFDENARIVVKEGPLLGLEGSIIRVDRRKHRAKVQFDLYDKAFTIDLAFEVMESTAK
jgi:transcriptional antiterminator NusG